MIYHFVVGDEAAAPLLEAIAASPDMEGEVIVLRDLLHLGPLKKEEGDSFSSMRSAFWKEVAGADKNPPEVDDMERMLEVSRIMFADETVRAWLWMAPLPADVAAYYWLLPYMSKHPGRFFLLNIAGLPFLDRQGKLFFPKSISLLPAGEVVKARKLARPLTASEVETDLDEWDKIAGMKSAIRVHEGGRKLVPKDETFYDHILTGLCKPEFQKASKVVTQALTKQDIPTGDWYLAWRVRELVRAGTLQAQGDTAKALKDFDIRKAES